MKRSVCGCAALIVTSVSASLLAADRWVAPGGTDTGAGPSTAPWKTLQYAADNA
jgi:hypothetical protein